MKKKQIINFTQDNLNKIPPAPKGQRNTYYDTIRPELILRVTDTGHKSFVIIKRLRHKTLRITLSSYPSMSIYQARQTALDKLHQVSVGINPNIKKKQFNQEMTLGQLFNKYISEYSKITKKTWKADEREIPKYFKKWFPRYLSEITEDDVRTFFIETTNKNGKYMANRLISRLSSMYNKAIKWGWTGNNPTKNIQKNKEKPRERFIHQDEINKIKETLEKMPFIFSAFVKLAIFTGARTCNIYQMRWDQIDFDSKIWYIPDSKNGHPLVIPLIDQAISVLKTIDASSEWVFPSKSKQGHLTCLKKSWKTFITEANLPDLRMHDLRRTHGSWLACNNVSLTTISHSLGHKNIHSTQIYAKLQTDPIKDAVQNTMNKFWDNNGRSIQPM